MATVSCWNKSITRFTFETPEPLRNFAMNYLAASGMFDKIVITTKDGTLLEAEGVELLKLADVVGPTPTFRIKDA